MVKRISKAAMLVAVFTLALALPVMAAPWQRVGTVYCGAGGSPRLMSSSYIPNWHHHNSNGVWRTTREIQYSYSTSHGWAFGVANWNIKVWLAPETHNYLSHSVRCY